MSETNKVVTGSGKSHHRLSKKKIIGLIIILVVVMAAGVVTYLIINHGSQKPANASKTNNLSPERQTEYKKATETKPKTKEFKDTDQTTKMGNT